MAALTLSEVLQGVYKDLGQLNVGKATGGSTTTIVDSAQANQAKDNVWRDGCAFVIRDAGGANAAPEGQFSRLSGSTNASGTFTMADALTVAAASGDIYGYCSQYFPLQQMIQSVNDGLRDLGDLDLVDTSTLTADSATREYAAAVSWKRRRPRRIDVQGYTGTPTTDNDWRPIPDGAWDWVPASPGTAGKIIFQDYLPDNYALRVWYRDRHPSVYAYNDPIAEVIEPEIAVAAAVVAAVTWQNNRISGADQFLLQRQAAAEQKLANYRAERATAAIPPGPRLFIIGQTDTEDDSGFTVPLPP